MFVGMARMPAGLFGRFSEPVHDLFMGHVAPAGDAMQGANRSRVGDPARICHTAARACRDNPKGGRSKMHRAALPALPRRPVWAATGVLPTAFLTFRVTHEKIVNRFLVTLPA
ncbi:hypothetical protein D8I35_16895 [Corticibacter populi]|uniref:Uncharacterized protein n=1 Tax=Corticibacter populi TaxID=1550736 RepID=A0A3M6QKD2_9BURK|nr:hypothetical protein D8I35_16895 [Corticibacter populi]